MGTRDATCAATSLTTRRFAASGGAIAPGPEAARPYDAVKQDGAERRHIRRLP